jgi:hypothetical protein
MARVAETDVLVVGAGGGRLRRGDRRQKAGRPCASPLQRPHEVCPQEIPVSKMVIRALHDAAREEGIEPPAIFTEYGRNLAEISYPLRMAGDLLKEGPKISEGYIEVPAGPGLGIEIDEGMIRKYRV